MEEEDGRMKALLWGVIRADSAQPIERRLDHLYREFLSIIDRWRPGAVALEDPYVGKNRRTIISLGQAQAVVLLACAQRGVSVHRYAPAETKQAVADYGNASKERMGELVRLTLGLKEKAMEEDASDALAVALCHLYRERLRAVLARQIG